MAELLNKDFDRHSMVSDPMIKEQIQDLFEIIANRKFDVAYDQLVHIYRQNIACDCHLRKDLTFQDQVRELLITISKETVVSGSLSDVDAVRGHLYYLVEEHSNSMHFLQLAIKEGKSDGLLFGLATRCLIGLDKREKGLEWVNYALSKEAHPRNFYLKALLTDPNDKENSQTGNRHMFLRNVVATFKINNQSVCAYSRIWRQNQEEFAFISLPNYTEVELKLNSSTKANYVEWLSKQVDLCFCHNHELDGINDNINSLGIEIQADIKNWALGVGVVQQPWEPPIENNLLPSAMDWINDEPYYPPLEHYGNHCDACDSEPCMCSDPG